MRVLVVGYGSIGARHTRVLRAMGHQVGVVSRRKIEFTPVFDDLMEALAQFQPQYVVIANETSAHYDALNRLAQSGYTGAVLVEKPLFHATLPLPRHSFNAGYVAYDMRFLPMMERVRELLKQERIISVQAYVGQYLPDWRPQQDYRATYSAWREKGGGVLRDLSHELDYLEWLFGSWRSVCARGGRYGNLEIDSDDVWSIMLELDNCPLVSLQMNYLDRVARRFLLVQTETMSLYADFIANVLYVNETKEQYAVDTDHCYQAEHQAVFENDYEKVCSLADGENTMKLIAAIEASAEKGVWVFNGKTV